MFYAQTRGFYLPVLLQICAKFIYKKREKDTALYKSEIWVSVISDQPSVSENLSFRLIWVETCQLVSLLLVGYKVHKLSMLTIHFFDILHSVK